MSHFLTRPKLGRQFNMPDIFTSFFKNQSNGGIILLISALIAIAAANIEALKPLGELWEKHLSISIGRFSLDMSLLHWINDGLMVVFFFVVGLEIKREMSVGELSSVKHAALPIIAAVGGMLFPALFYSVFNHGTPSQNGWGIPMATDIAFAIGILSLMSKRVPLSIKVFLTALAIVDDLGAIIVLALFYPTHAINFELLLFAAGILALLFTFNKLNVQRATLYIIPGIVLWLLILGSGLHATVAGVLLAMTIPGNTKINKKRFYNQHWHLLQRFQTAGKENVDILACHKQKEIIDNMHSNLRQINPLMNRFERSTTPIATFLIIPLFALANAGVEFSADLLHTFPALSKGIFFGLLLGKPVGIFLSSFVACKLGIAELPTGVDWKLIFSVGIIAGIGFTMSIFIDNLAFDTPELVESGKAAILITSFAAAVIGSLAIYLTTRNKEQTK